MSRTPRPRRRPLRITLACTAAVAAGLTATGPAAAADPAPGGALARVAAAASSSPHAVAQAAGPTGIASPTAAPRLQGVTASNLFLDPPGDGALAPDLQQMVPLSGDDGRYTVGITLDSNALIEGDTVVTFANSDGNAATGEPTFGGADMAVSIIGFTGQDAVVAARWDGFSFQDVASPSLVSFASGATDEVWSVSAAEFGIAAGATTTLVFGTLHEGLYYDYFDFAPEPGIAPFAFTVGALAAPPPPPPPPSAPAPPASAPTRDAASAPSPALGLRGFALSRSGAGVRMRVGWVQGQGTVSWRLSLTARVDGRRVTRTVRGRGLAGSRTVARRIALPGWTGATVSARLLVQDDARTLTRRRTIRL